MSGLPNIAVAAPSDALNSAIHDLEELVALQKTAAEILKNSPDQTELAAKLVVGVLTKMTGLRDRLEKEMTGAGI